MGQVTLISGRERRRRWSPEDRARIMAAMSAPDAIVAEIARREDIATSLIYKWRREARKGAKKVEFAQVLVETAPSTTVRQGSKSAADVILVEVNDARVRISAQAPAALIAATVKALRA